MKIVKQFLKEKYNLSNYQIAQLIFLGKTVLSESSKILIMSFIFYKQLPLYFFSLLIMCILRYSTDGIHFYTYMGCLTASTSYLVLGIKLLPKIPVSINIKLMLLLICTLICYYVGPVLSKYRPPCNTIYIRKRKLIISFFIFLYTMIIYIIPKSQYLIVGFWIIILHSLQLIIAKYTRKESC